MLASPDLRLCSMYACLTIDGDVAPGCSTPSTQLALKEALLAV